MDFAKAVVIYLSTIVFFVLVVDCKSKDLLVSVFVGGRRYRPGFRSRWQCFFSSSSSISGANSVE